MYLGVILIYAFTPLALGFWWMVLPALSIIPILAVRIRNEEEVLARDLPGYGGYLQKVKYRLCQGCGRVSLAENTLYAELNFSTLNWLRST